MYHFIGIKGSGMSSLAQMMDMLGFKVQGSDISKHFFTEEGLKKRNIKVLEFNKNNINKNLIIVKGNAFNKDNNEEVKESLRLGLKIYTYQEMVGKIVSMHNTIAICGCHGKTTTSSLLSEVLDKIYGCNFLIGDGTGYASKKNKLFVLEACEYKRHFLSYYPEDCIVTNIELDHVDYYKDIDDVIDAYQSFISNVKNIAIINGDDDIARKLQKDNIVYFGMNENNDSIAKNIILDSKGIQFDYYFKNEFIYHFNLPFYGKHMIYNSLAVITYCHLKSIDLEKVNKYLKLFKGAKRRFSEKFVKDNVVIDDYAHHPTEIETTILAARQKYPDKKIISIFQPHTYTRTIKFKKELSNALNKSDKVFLLDIYGARESKEDFKNITYKIISDNIYNAEHINNNEAKKLLKYNNSVLLFMSPNDLSVLINEYIKLKGNIIKCLEIKKY